MRLTPAGFMGAKAALRQLKAKVKSKATGYDAIDEVIQELVSELDQYDSNWQNINLKLSEVDTKARKHMTAVWIMKSRSKKQTNILQYGYISPK